MDGKNHHQALQPGNNEGVRTLELRRNALFEILSRTLIGTSEWRTQIFITWFLSFFMVTYGIYWMEGLTLERKALCILAYLFMCKCVVDIQKSVRDRDEADKLERYAKGTDLYNAGYIATVRDSYLYYAFGWLCFLVSFASLTTIIWHMEASTERKGYLGAGGLLLVSSTFGLTKTVRDSRDGKKWYSGYYNISPDQASNRLHGESE